MINRKKISRPIFCIIGLSGSGKSTILRMIMKENHLGLSPLVYHTTRERRPGEVDGKDYYFVDDEQRKKDEEINNVVEMRIYHKVSGTVYYYTTRDDINDKKVKAYIGACSVDQVKKYIEHNCEVYVINVETNLKTRLERLTYRADSDDEIIEACRRIVEERGEYSGLNDINKDLIFDIDNDKPIDFLSNIAKIEEFIKNHI